jgi:hypothetical protein
VRGSGGGGGEPLAEYGAGFHCDDKGVCGTSWQQQTDNILCSNADSYESSSSSRRGREPVGTGHGAGKQTDC